MKLASRTLPASGVIIQIKTKRSKAWRAGTLYAGNNGFVYWEIWHKNTVKLQGIEPGDRWKSHAGENEFVVEKFNEIGGKKMTLDEAMKINEETYQWCVAHVVGDPPRDPPPQYSLADMLEAARMVQGKHVMKCADRLIAAMHVLGSYAASPLSNVDIIVAGNGKAVLVVNLSEITAKDNENDDIS